MDLTIDKALHNVHPEDHELVQKLARLQDIHEQIYNLRGLLPERLLQPVQTALTNPRITSPEKLAARLKQAATDGSHDLQQFKKDFHSAEMRELWQQTNTADFGQGCDLWTVDYQALVKNLKSDQSQPRAPDVSLDGVAGKDEAESSPNEESIISRFQDAKSVLKVTKANDPGPYPIAVIVDGISFSINRTREKGQKVLVVEQDPSSEQSKLASDIVGIVNERDDLSNLELLLNMLASYHDLRFKVCDKCQSIFDKDMRYPLLRQTQRTTKDASSNIEWQILHRSCAL